MAQREFLDRTEAGRLLAAELERINNCEDGIVLALPRGGVPVAFEVAKHLRLPLDLMLVRKLGLPGQEELAMGAISTGGAVVYNEPLLRQLQVGDEALQRVKEREQTELARREQAYRGDRPLPSLEERCVILVDDGLATGATMRAAIEALRQQAPRRVVVAVPVAPPETAAELEQEADEVVCLATPVPFYGVGRWYRSFEQTSDDEVRALLSATWDGRPATAEERGGTPRPGAEPPAQRPRQ